MSNSQLLNDIEVLQILDGDAAKPALRAIDFVGQIAQQWGAKVYVAEGFPQEENFFGRGKSLLDGVDIAQWLAADKKRIALIACGDEGSKYVTSNSSSVMVEIAPWHSEATLLAESGLSELLGDPKREPLVPVGDYAACSVGYAVLAALSSVAAKVSRFGHPEQATVNGLASIGWINWKSAAAGAFGKNIHREGENAEWPCMPCKDGFAAMVYTERDWDSVVNMIDDDGLRVDEFKTFEGRQKNRDGYMEIVRRWTASKTKAELMELYYQYKVPGAPVSTPADVLQDPLLLHRNAFIDVQRKGKAAKSPVAPHRVEKSIKNDEPARGAENANADTLPLEGIRVLDLGIITAGAGTTGLLADMGAEVLKVESETYPDPFRMWAGSAESPLFNFNNRNKYGVAIDLKTEEGKEQLFKLVESADVIVENFRRGVLDRLGFTLEALRERNPNFVLASISSQGVTGPYCDHSTFGSTLEASSGFAAQTCYEDEGVPYITGRNVNYPDQTVCFYGAAAIAAAVVKARQDNAAIHVDISQRDVAMFILGDVIEYISTGVSYDVNQLRKDLCRYVYEGTLPTKDSRYVSVAISDFEMLSGLGIANQAGLSEWLADQEVDTAVELLLKSGVGAAKVHYGDELLTNPAMVNAKTYLKSPEGNLVKGFPFLYDSSEQKIWANAPTVGQHTKKFVA